MYPDPLKAEEFSKSLNIPFNNLALLQQALVHRSYVNENKRLGINHNERLEFLGDAVLELVVTEYLFANFPASPEGELTSFRAAIVRTESLAQESLKLNVGDYLMLSKGESASGGRKRPYILANAFEAIIGAIYLDQGYEVAKKFIIDHLIYKLAAIVNARSDIDPKSKLQELVQEVIKLTPNYLVISEEGPDHDKTFRMALSINGFELSQGSGRSKQDAEQDAAQFALQNWPEVYKKYQSSVKITTNQIK